MAQRHPPLPRRQRQPPGHFAACGCCALPRLLAADQAPRTTVRPGVKRGYRGHGLSLWQCAVGSTVQLNNETVNVHSHLLPALYFAWIAATDEPGGPATAAFRGCTTLFLAGAFAVHLCSALYHCFSAYSNTAEAWLLRLDLAGIGFFILACMINGVVLGFRCAPGWRAVYLTTQSCLGAVTLLAPLLPKRWSFQRHSSLVAMYTVVVCSGLVPAAHWVAAVASPTERALMLPRIVGFFARLGLGLAFYLSRWPEARWPGRFDTVGQSHQLWHLAVSAAALYWWETLRIYTGLIERHPNCPQ